MDAKQWGRLYADAAHDLFRSKQPRSAAQAMYPNLQNADEHRQAEREREAAERAKRAKPRARWRR